MSAEHITAIREALTTLSARDGWVHSIANRKRDAALAALAALEADLSEAQRIPLDLERDLRRAERAEAELQTARAACNICGEPWPNHYEHCAYPSTLRELQAALAELAETKAALQDELDNWNPETRPTISAQLQAALEALRAYEKIAAKQPIEVDISDFSDEFCIGFLRGQVNMLEALSRRAVLVEGAPRPAVARESPGQESQGVAAKGAYAERHGVSPRGGSVSADAEPPRSNIGDAQSASGSETQMSGRDAERVWRLLDWICLDSLESALATVAVFPDEGAVWTKFRELLSALEADGYSFPVPLAKPTAAADAASEEVPARGEGS